MQRLIYLLFLIVSLLSIGCKESVPSNEKTVTDSSSLRMDTSNQYLYDFMQVVIKDQQLRYDYGLVVIPETAISNEESDESFLKSFLMEEKKATQKKVKRKKHAADSSATDSSKVAYDSSLRINTDYIFISPSLAAGNYRPQKLLSQEDLDYMLSEKDRLQHFNWDHKRLGFNVANQNNWYVFSLPYFSKDKKTAVLLIRDLCKPFLCGGGSILLYRQEEGKWKSQEIERWIH